MFENIIKYFKNFNKKEEKEQINNSKEAAKERLHLVLMQDRANVSADFLELMKQEIIEVIKKYIDVDEGAIDVRLTNQESENGVNGVPALYANIPIVNIKNEARKVDTKEEKKKEEKKVEKKNEKPANKEKTEKSEKTEKEEEIEEIQNERIAKIILESKKYNEEKNDKKEEEKKQEENNIIIDNGEKDNQNKEKQDKQEEKETDKEEKSESTKE